MTDPVEAYASELRRIRASGAGVAETSYYGALSQLLTAVGSHLKPKVRCFMQLRNRGAGNPDGGLFTSDQFAHAHDESPLEGELPARGAIEVKGTGDDIFKIAADEQVSRYAERYGLVLVTNLRDFVLVERDEHGEAVVREHIQLARTEAAFWAAIQQPRAFADVRREGLTQYLMRVMRHNAPILTPKDVAWYLASYARQARLRLEHRTLPSLDSFKESLEEALGFKFRGERGDHFFRSTLVQTLFYGLFAGWVLWARERANGDGAERFRWREAAWTLHVPMIRVLFERVASPSQLGKLQLAEILDWAEHVLDRVDRVEFFSRFREEHAVQYFYEPFLEHFDPELRKELGVWYTPEEVVRYMVARVDTVLREELGVADGLADPNVWVLDPCCGTGAYLVEVLRRIDRTFTERGADALSRHELKQAAMSRIVGFEIMPAPFVVAHLQLGLLLRELGVPLDEDSNERPAVYLTNALTGWQASDSTPERLMLSELEDERDAAAHVKQEAPILVILGNPPYNGYAGMAMDEERELSEAYRTTKRAPKPQGQGLNDLYVRFYRMAERRIVEQTGRGIVCLISNYSWLDGLSFTGMRERYLEVFDQIWIDSLNGDKYKTGKVTPNGKPDPSIFSTAHNREGIQVGTTIGLFVRRRPHSDGATVEFRDLWGTGKWQRLDQDAQAPESIEYAILEPSVELGYPLVPGVHTEKYFKWPSLPEIFPVSFPGVTTARDDFLVDIDKERLEERLAAYFDPEVAHEDMQVAAPSVMRNTARFDAVKTRDLLRQRGLLSANIVPYLYRPMDVRWLYWEPETKLLDEKRSAYFPHVGPANLWISGGQRNRQAALYQPQVTKLAADYHIVESNASLFPAVLAVPEDEASLFKREGSSEAKPNLSSEATEYARVTGGVGEAGARRLMHHILAILHSPAYIHQNAGALRQDWPRIPLPEDATTLADSAKLGGMLAKLLQPSAPVQGVTAGDLRRELSSLGLLSRTGGGSLDPGAGDLGLTAAWGRAGRGGIAMPGPGHVVEREYTDDEIEALGSGAANLGTDEARIRDLLGSTTFDVYLNNVARWRNVPANVWRYTLGGYQVIKKWLSYRERDLLGRDLTPEEARYVTEMVRRIAALLLVQPELDANYERVKADAVAWTTKSH